MDLGGRRELVRVLVGSHNYNLNTVSSDRDYKIFIAPTFNDLYFGNEFKSSIIGETEDYVVHDIRKMSKLFEKANINFLEILFSISCDINHDNLETASLLRQIFNMKHDIVKMNLPYLYNACVGMHFEKRDNVRKGTSSTQCLVDKFGYDTKQALHSLRVLDFLRKFADNNFTDFQAAIWYDDDSFAREYLLEVKDGKYTYEQYYNHAANLLALIRGKYEDKYKSREFDAKTGIKLDRLIKEIVRKEILSKMMYD